MSGPLEGAVSADASRVPAGVRAVVALGSNLGDRDATLRQAVADLDSVPHTRVAAASVPIETVALTIHGLDDTKPAYLNGVVLLETALSADDLLTELNRIEDRHGRLRAERWGDRTLDLDLIAHGDARLDTERLTLPHPRAAERSFVLEPWLQVDPDATLPGAGRADALLAGLHEPVSHVAGALPLDAQLVPRASGARA